MPDAVRKTGRRLTSLIAGAALVTGAVLVLPMSTASAAPTRYEAENSPATCSGTIDSNWAGFSGSGFCNGTNAVGAAAQFTVSASAAGTATLGVRFANGTTTARPASLIVNLIVFGRLTAQNRLLVGGGPAPYYYGRDMREHHMRNPGSVEVLRETLTRYFPMWRDLRFTHAYGGCIDMTRDLVPHVGTLGDGVFYGHGYCGNGIAFTHTAGKVLRDLILERHTAYTDLLFVGGREPSFPPEPLTWLRERARSALLSFQDRHPDVIRRQLI